MTPNMAARILAFETTTLQYQGIRPNPERIHEAASVLGRLGGYTRSPARAAASRINGRKGGRPRNEKK